MKRSWLWLILVWCLLCAASVSVRLVVTRAMDGDLQPGRLESLAKHVSNTLDGGAILGWVIVGGRIMTSGNVWGAIVANMIGWAPWCLLLGLIVRGGWRVRAQAAGSDESPSAEQPVDDARRRFLTRVVGIPAVTALGGAGIVATAVAPWRIRTAKYDVAIRDLPPSLDGVRIAFLTDTHLGRRIPVEHIEEAVRIAIDLNPDLFLLGGDYIDHAPSMIEPCAALLRPLVQTGKPVVGVLGNHDYYTDAPRVMKAITAEGIHGLLNSRVYLTGSRALISRPVPGDCLCIAGLDDLWEGTPSIDAALDGVDPTIPRLVLSHNPDCAEEPNAGIHRVDLMLSGHTHGGQVRFPLVGAMIVPSRYGQKYAQGLVQGPHFPVVISAGIGMAIVPVRLNVPPEVAEVTLRRTGA